MKKICIKCFILILKIIYFPIKIFKVKRKVVYISRQFNKGTLDFDRITKYMEERYPDIENVVLAKRMEKGIINKILYFLHMIVQMYHISTSKVVIVDSYCIVSSVLKHKKETKIIQIWHAISAIKKFGYQTIGKMTGANKLIADAMCMHKNYDYVLCSSKITAKYFEEAFNIEEEKIKYLGLPRLDYILQENKEKTEELYNTYPELKNKINILYVPTFRKFKKVKINDVIQRIDTKKYNLIVKLHPLDKKNYTYLQKEGIIYDDIFKSYDWLKMCDKVITDYSSLAMETSLLGKPVYFYIYDFKIYQEDPGLNFDFKKEEIGKYATNSSKKIVNMLDREYDFNILDSFRKKYINVESNNYTEDLTKFIMELIDNEYEENIKTEINKLSQEELTV